MKPYNFNSEFFSGDLLKKYIDMTYKRHQNYLKIKTFKWNEELEYFNKKGDYDDYYYYYEGILDLAKAIIKDELEQM